MNLVRLRWLLLVRWLRLVGWLLPVVLLFAAGVGWIYLSVARVWPLTATLVVPVLLLGLHRSRRDLDFLRTLLANPRRHIAFEYLLLATLPGAILVACGQSIHAAALLVVAPLPAFVPQRRMPGIRLQRLRIRMLGYSPEWTAGIRRRPLVAAAVLGLVACCAALPYWGFIALMVAALFCSGLYTGNEPLQLLILSQKGSARLLWSKVRTAWRNYFFAATPFALITAVLHPHLAWFGAIWLPFSLLVLLYAVVAKYAFYDPSIPTGTSSLTAQTGLVGFIVLPLLPVSLCLLVAYALRAERNLNRYLYDYH